MKTKVILVAGGTAGHINSSLALGKYLKLKGLLPIYFSGTRHLDYKLYQGLNAYHLNSLPLRYVNPIKVFHSLLKNFLVFLKVYKILWKERPALAIGAGGYVCGPVLIAAFLQRIPVYIIEQNGVLGLTNKLLSIFSNKIFLHFKNTLGISSFFSSKYIVCGNPVREEIVALSKESYSNIESTSVTKNSINILIFGGSLGATSINKLIYKFISSLEIKFTFKLHLKHQVGKEDYKSAQDFLVTLQQNNQIIYNHYEYLDNIVEDYKWSDLVICRSGASTLSELRYVKKPVILIPFPYHKDRHQFYNAKIFKEENIAPVFIHSAEELEENSFQKLKEIILNTLQVKLVKDSALAKNASFTEVGALAEEIIFEEIKKHV